MAAAVPYATHSNIGQVQFPFAGVVLACLGEARRAAPAFKLIPTLHQVFPPSCFHCNYAKIQAMKAVLPKPVHASYRRHRQQRTVQILLPIVLAALVFLVMVVLINIATFRDNGDVARWAAVSTIWIAIPICVMGFVFLALFGGLVYLMGRLLGIVPTYTGKAQDFVHKLGIRIRRAADMTVKPIIYLDGVGATLKALLGRK